MNPPGVVVTPSQLNILQDMDGTPQGDEKAKAMSSQPCIER